MGFQGTKFDLKNKDTIFKLEYDLKIHKELHKNYELITKLVIICLKKKLKLIIENPYSNQHYLTRYWALKPSLIDYNRKDRGDYFEKPTQYFFINCEPQNNLILEGIDIKEKKRIAYAKKQVERSMISRDYANRFIREFILKD